MVLRYVPPAEFETAYHDRQALQSAWRFSRNALSGKPATVQDHSERRIAILILVSDS
jgi:hypothetical protein